MDAGAVPSRIVRRSWVWGGSLLIAGTLVGFLPQLVRGTLWAGMPWTTGAIAVFITAAGWLLFAYGRDRVVPRPVGVVALTVLAGWPVLGMFLPPFVYGTLLDPVHPSAVVGYVDVLVPVIAAVIAAVEVYRAGQVPRQFRRVPLIAVGLCVLPEIVLQLAFTALGSSAPLDASLLIGLTSIATLCQIVGLIGLGVIAIIAGMQPRAAEPVSVYSSGE